MRVERSLFVDASPEAVFELVSDPDRWAEFGVGLTRWEPRSKRTKGKGARFKVLVKVGSIEAGGLVRITEWQRGRVIEWRSEQGIDQSGRWLLGPVEGGGTELSLQLEYDLVGPLSGLVERLAGRILGRNMEASLLAARRIVEAHPGSRTGASAAPKRTPAPRPPGRSPLVRMLDVARPKVLATLRRAGVFTPAGVVAAAGAVPWYVGRGPSLGIVSQLNAVALPRRDAIIVTGPARSRGWSWTGASTAWCTSCSAREWVPAIAWPCCCKTAGSSRRA